MKRSASHRAKSVTAATPRGAVKVAALTRAETAGASSKYFRLSCKSRGALGRHAARSERAVVAPRTNSFRRVVERVLQQASELTTR